MPVSDQHKEYIKYLPRVLQVRDCVEGADAVKTRDGGKKYLPKPNASDLSQENEDRYTAYKKRASYVNFTGQTKEGMLGMVFRKPMAYELPDAIKYLEENATGGGLSLEQLTVDIVGDELETAKYGILVDYPDAEEGVTQAEVTARGLRASLLPYPFESIVNWRCEVIDGVKKLSLVVLHEMVEEVDDDGFGSEDVDQYRVLRLTDGVYTQQLYDEDSKPKGEEYSPRDFSGGTWDAIPFVIIGAQNNDETTDKAPLYDISEINLAHYRNSADYEESSFMVGQPTPVISGLSQSWVEEVLKGGVLLGSTKALLLPVDADAKLMQAESNQMPLKGMELKEDQLIKTGARIIQDSSGNETAEAARIRFGGQNSKLSLIVMNVKDGLTKACEWAIRFMGGDGEVSISINTEFYDKTLDAQQVMALIQLADRGDISSDALNNALNRAGWTDEDDDEGGDDTRGFNLEPINNATLQPQGQAVESQALISILEKLTAAPVQGELMTAEPIAPNITIEAPVFNIQVPEGLIAFPENMVNVEVSPPSVTVEAAQINVEAPQITVEGTTIQEGGKSISIQRDENGDIIGAESE